MFERWHHQTENKEKFSRNETTKKWDKLCAYVSMWAWAWACVRLFAHCTKMFNQMPITKSENLFIRNKIKWIPSVEHTEKRIFKWTVSNGEVTVHHLKCFEETSAYIGGKVYFFLFHKLKRSTVYIDARSSHTNKSGKTERKEKGKRETLRKLRFVYSFVVSGLKKKSRRQWVVLQKSFSTIAIDSRFSAMMFLCSYWFQKFSHVISAFRVLSNWVSREQLFVCACLLFAVHFVVAADAEAAPHKSIH